jgi:hypothetical protein
MSHFHSKQLTRRNFLGELAASALSAATADVLTAAPALAKAGAAAVGPRSAGGQVKIGIVGGGFGAVPVASRA